MTGFPILAYHSVDDDGAVTSVPPAAFRAQLARLAELGLRAVDLDEVVARLRRGEPLPEDGVAITFDDGYRSVHDVAAPLLAERGFHATVFLAIEPCGLGGRAAPTRGEGLTGRPMMGEREARALAASGRFRLGAHSLTHRSLPGLPAEEAAREVLESRRIVDELAGPAASGLFAYPYGHHVPALRALVREGFLGAVGTRLDLVHPGSDPFALPRIDAFYLQSRAALARLGGATFGPWLAARRLARGVRRRFAGQPAE